MEWVTTTILLDRLCDFEDAAWEHFTNRFRTPVVRFACRMGLPEQEAQDVAQESLAAFANGLRDGRYDRTKGRLSSWLFGIAYYESKRAMRDAARSPRQAPGVDGKTTFFSALPDEGEAKASWERDWERFVTNQCLERLRGEVTPMTYAAFEMVALREAPANEVARELGITRNAVFIAKHRALKRLGELHAQFEGVA